MIAALKFTSIVVVSMVAIAVLIPIAVSTFYRTFGPLMDLWERYANWVFEKIEA